MEEQPNIYRVLIEERNIYPENFVLKWGHASSYWSKESWHKRELSLRHDLCCILLCNLERLTTSNAADQIVNLPSPKRPRVETIAVASSSTSNLSFATSSSSSFRSAKSGSSNANQEDEFRYVLIEGMPSENRLMNKLSSMYGAKLPSISYDIFDVLLKQWIEVKVTQDYYSVLEEFRNRKEDGVNSALIWIHPQNYEHKLYDRVASLPGLTKAKEFLMSRSLELRLLTNMPESGFLESTDIVGEIFRCERLNNDVDAWVDTVYSMRDNDPVPLPKTTPDSLLLKTVTFKQLADMIEDTSLRTSEVMKFSGKILPTPIAHSYQTNCETDKEMIDEFFERFDPIPDTDYSKIVQTIKRCWVEMEEKSTFTFINKRRCTDDFPSIAKALGIDAKRTVRNDACPDLKQEEFKGYSKARYSPWLSNLMRDCSLEHGKSTLFDADLSEIEHMSINPMGKQSQIVRRTFFHQFSKTVIAEYCSSIKGVYSRLGGAYLERNEKGNHGYLMIFPIYSVGTDVQDSEKRNRYVSGVVIRGPHHAKNATDRIPIITIEVMRRSEKAKLYSSIVKKAHIVNCSNGFDLIVRQNSVMKYEASFLTFVHNATYLTANFIGEVVMQSNMTMRYASIEQASSNFFLECPQWISERIVESVFMAVLGKSQEEGMFAIIRKIYMAVLAMKRGDKPLSRNWKGLIDKLNECLMDSPLALYWAQQIRISLLRLDLISEH